MNGRRGGSFAFVCGLLASLANAQVEDQPAAAELVFGERVDVSLVELDVLVLDRKGDPIRGLLEGAFRVLENGVERPLGGFAERSVSGSRPAIEVPGAAVGSPELAPSGLVVVFLDHVALRPDRRARVLRFLRLYLEELGASGALRFGLVTNDLPLKVAISPTDDSSFFLKELAELPTPPASSARGYLDRQRAADAIGGGGGPSGSPTNLLNEACMNARLRVLGELAQYVDAVERRNRRSLLGLDAVVTMLGGVEGRKILLYAGEGLALQPGLEMSQRAANVCPDLQGQVGTLAGPSYEPELRRLAANANAHRVSIHAIDAAGARVEENLHLQLRQLRASNLQDSLSVLASSTGGRLFKNVGDVRFAFKQVARDLQHSYSLAYVLGQAVDGTVRSVNVELVGPGLQRAHVLHRRAIRPIDDTDRLVASLYGALWLGEESNPLALQVSATSIEQGVAVHLRIPHEKMVLDDESPPDRWRMFLVARDPSTGNRTLPKEYLESLSAATLSEATDRGWFEATVNMELPNGSWTIAVGVRDEATSRTSVLRMTNIIVEEAGD